MIDLVGLQALLAVEEQGSVGGAAASLGYTPSAVSQQVKRLERDLQQPLLERVGRGVVLTEPARQVVAEGRSLLRNLERMQARLDADAGSVRGRIRLASHSTALRGLVAPTLGQVRRSAPDLAITVVERDPAEGVELLMSGQVDLAVVHNWIGVPLHIPTGVEVRQVALDRADVLVPADSHLAARRWVTAKDLIDQRFASTPVGTICHGWFLQMFAGHVRSPEVDYWSAEFASHVALVRAGLAVAVVPRLGRGPLPDGVVAVAVRDPVPTRQIFAIYRSTMTASPALRHLTDALVATARTSRGPE